MPIETIRQLQIDVIGSCNLRCPTCLVGSMDPHSRSQPKGTMSEKNLASILDKAVQELPSLELVALHNWTEPLLHPKLPELIRLTKSYGLRVYVSTNLNVLRRAEDLLRSGIDELAVSVSSCEQERYEVYHRGGAIHKVKANMETLAAAKEKTESNTELVCIFHRYIDNNLDEALMWRFAKRLGFRFLPVWAYFTPVEKILASQSPNKSYKGIRFTSQDEAIACRLAVTIEERLALARQQTSGPCIPQTRQLPIDWTGNVRLCCGSGFLETVDLGPFLESSSEEIQAARESHDLCNECNQCGIPKYYHGVRGAALNRIGNAKRKQFESGPSGGSRENSK